MRLLFFVPLLFAAFISIPVSTNAQVCNGSLGAPVVNETFGSGKTFGEIGAPLAPGITNLKYNATSCGGEDGEYSLLSSMGTSCKGGTWKYIGHDHTGDKNGYMMIINATDEPSEFFTYRVKGELLCANTNYQFAAWVLNILRDLPQTKGYSEPNITFSIEKPDGTVLKSFNTGNIKADDLSIPSWKQYGTFFTSPNDGSDVIVKMTNNSRGGLGNDLALDDITFSPCGPLIQTGFAVIGNTGDKNNCINDDLNYTLVAQQQGYLDPAYQWQRKILGDTVWTDVSGATTTTYNVVIPNARVGLYQYRIGVLSSANAGSEKCRIYSDPLNINVYPLPTYPLSSTTTTCIGSPLILRAEGGDSYLWTGPNNFTSIENSPTVTVNADHSYEGDYTLRIIKNGCPFFATTTVRVFDAVTAEPLNDVAICEGGSVQFNVVSTNATKFKWYPSTGLDRDDIANPTATPGITTTYKVEISNDACPGYIKSATSTVTVYKNPVADAGKTFSMNEGETAKLNGKASGDNIVAYWTPAEYLDDPTSLTPVTTATANITYTLHVESTVGCGISTSSVFVRVYKKLGIVNTFTPNSDGVNDIWNIKNIDDYPNAQIDIYDRGGQRIFHSIGYGKPWDGTNKGSKAIAGTYYYIIDFKEGGLKKKSGWVLLVR